MALCPTSPVVPYKRSKGKPGRPPRAAEGHFCAILPCLKLRFKNRPKGPGQPGGTCWYQDQPLLMPRILSISYDQVLLHTRELILAREGFEVESAVGFSAAVEACKNEEFDLVIMGHSIPSADKAAIITQLRAICDTPILALRRPNDAPLKTAEYSLDPGDPQAFISYVKEITSGKARRQSSPGK